MSSLSRRMIFTFKSYVQKIRRIIQARAWQFRRLQSAFPAVICIDVGASYFPHTSWWFFLGSKRTRWIAVEPNKENLTYLKSWPWKANLKLVDVGLSEFGGPMTLYKTNVDSGSSLLKPILHESNLHRFDKHLSDYFLPMQELQIETLAITDIISEFEISPIIIKLDTQGSELSIIRGFLESKSEHVVVGIEIECSLLALPQYQDSPRFWNIASYLEEKGFELLNLDVFPSRIANSKYVAKSRNISSECDAVFALRIDPNGGLNVESRACLLGFYITNAFYQEALNLLKKDQQLCSFLKSDVFDLERVFKALNRR